MRKIISTVSVLAVVVVASCRPTLAPAPTTNPTSPLPTPIAPQVVPETTRAGSIGPMSTPLAVSGIHLTAMIGPTCPGPERPGQVCSQPYEGLFVVTDNTGAEVARATTDRDGQATIDLPPGDYTITPQVESRWPSGAPTTVTVVSGQYVEVSIELESGIR